MSKYYFVWPLVTLVGILPTINALFVQTDIYPNLGIQLIIVGSLGGIASAIRKRALFVWPLIAIWALSLISFVFHELSWFCEGFGCFGWIWLWVFFMIVGLVLLWANAMAFYGLSRRKH